MLCSWSILDYKFFCLLISTIFHVCFQMLKRACSKNMGSALWSGILCPWTPEKFSSHLCMSSHNFPLRCFINFSTLVRNTSERLKVFAQRKCTVGMGKVELLKKFFGCILSKQTTPETFSDIQLLLLGFGSSLPVMFGSQTPRSQVPS